MTTAQKLSVMFDGPRYIPADHPALYAQLGLYTFIATFGDVPGRAIRRLGPGLGL